MKQTGILFKPNMVKMIGSGIKRMTRRKVKPQPDADGIAQHVDTRNWEDTSGKIYKCPYGDVGDELYVREAHYQYGKWVKNGTTKTGKQKWKFYSPKNIKNIKYLDAPPRFINKNTYRELGWYKRNALFMPKWASRYFLTITNIRVERLQQIKEDDVKNEGAGQDVRQMWLFGANSDTRDTIYRIQFKTLWESINGVGSWSNNDFVFVITFKLK